MGQISWKTVQNPSFAIKKPRKTTEGWEDDMGKWSKVTHGRNFACCVDPESVGKAE